MGVEVLEADISPEQVNVIEIDDSSLPEIDSKRESNSKHGFEEPVISGLIDNSREENRETKEVNEVEATNRLFNLMDTSQVLRETKEIYEVEAALDNRCDEITGVEVLEADISPEQVNVIESDDGSLPEIDNKTESNSKHGFEEPVKSGLMDNSHEVNGEAKEVNVVEATNHLLNLMDNSQELGEMNKINDGEAALDSQYDEITGVEVLEADISPDQINVIKSDDGSLLEIDNKTESNSKHGFGEPVKSGLMDNSHEVNEETKEINEVEATNHLLNLMDNSQELGEMKELNEGEAALDSQYDEITGVEVMEADISPEQVNVLESDDSSLPEIDNMTESNSKHGFQEPAKSGLVDNSHEVDGEIKEINEVEATNHLLNLMDNSQELGEMKEINEVEAALDNQYDEIIGVEVLEADISPKQVNVIESDDSSHPEIDSKTESNSEHGFEEPAKSGSVDSHEMNGEIKEITEVEATNHPINLMDNSQELDRETKEINEVEAANQPINLIDKSRGLSGDAKEINEVEGANQPINLMDNSQKLIRERKETNEADSANLPKDAADEWPAPKQIHRFCFVRFRPYEDPKLKAKIEQADKDLRKKNETRFQIIEALKAKRSERANLISQLKPLTGENKRYRTVIDEKRKEMEPLTTALGKLRDMNSAGREKGIGLCSSEEELDDLIHNLYYRIQHESNTLAEEKKLLKEMKQLEGTREKVIAHAATKARIQDSLGQKEAIQDQVKLIGIDMDGVRKEKKTVVSKMEHLEKELKIIDDGISFLQEELATVTEKRDTAYRTLSELRKERREANGCFYQNRSLLSNAKILAAKKNKAALEDLCHNEVERFMAQWNSNKALRDDYERRILPSLDIRQLSRDGRRRNPDEKLIREARLANEVEKASLKMTTAETNENLTLPPPDNVVDKPKVQEEVKSSTEVEPMRKSDHLEDTEKNYEIKKSKELPKGKDIDLEKLKEMRREEEIAKAKLAMERKKKLAEKAAAKAAARAQKEAEKKMKEKERKAKKKAGTSESATSCEQAETVKEKTFEPDEAKVNADVHNPTIKKEQKAKVNYKARAKASNQVPKVLLKKKKLQLYWAWAVPAAFLAVVFAVVGWYYFGRN